MELFIGLVIGAVVAAVIVYLMQEVRRRQEVARLEGQLDRAQDTEALLEAAKAELNTAFQAAAGQALQANNKQFLTLADQNFKKSVESFESLVKPLSENYQKLNPNIESLMRQNVTITETTQGLRDALSDNRQVGAWGEIQLRRIIELANMVDYCDFSEQTTADDGSGRPDVTVRLPENRAIVIDSKASATAYLEAQEAGTDEEAQQALIRHAGAMRTKVDDLAKKNYGQQVVGSLDFVVMFVPGDQFLAAALSARNDLIEYAMSKRIAITTPSSLISLLWAVASGWQQHRLAEDAEKIRQVGEEMHRRLLTFMRHYSGVGERLGRAVDSFNDSVASFDERLIPQVRRFAELRGRNAQEFTAPGQIGAEPRDSRYGVGEAPADADDKNEPD